VYVVESLLEAVTGCCCCCCCCCWWWWWWWWLEFECYSYVCCTGSVGQGVLAICLLILVVIIHD